MPDDGGRPPVYGVRVRIDSTIGKIAAGLTLTLLVTLTAACGSAAPPAPDPSPTTISVEVPSIRISPPPLVPTGFGTLIDPPSKPGTTEAAPRVTSIQITDLEYFGGHINWSFQVETTNSQSIRVDVEILAGTKFLYGGMYFLTGGTSYTKTGSTSVFRRLDCPGQSIDMRVSWFGTADTAEVRCR